MATPFNIVKGSEAAIKSCNPIKGYLWFALDTRKIYYSDGEDFISMGGNSSVFYGTLTWSEDNLPDSDQVEFDFTMADIEGDATPNVNDLILNNDGCFYRVTAINGAGSSKTIRTLKLTIAGSGTGGGSGGSGDIPVSTSVITIAVPTATKYFLDTEENPTFSFEVRSTKESGNKISKITYTIGSRTFVDDEPHNFGTITLNLKDYFSFIAETGTNFSFVVEDTYGARKTSSTYVLQKVKLLLKDDNSNKTNILQATNKTLQYRVIPTGSGALRNVALIYNIYVEGSNSPIWTETKNVNALNGSVVSYDLHFDNIDPIGNGLGAYFLEVVCSGTAGGQTINSNTLKHSIISYGENPVLIAYLPTKKIVQYDSIDISYEIAKSVVDNQKARITFEVDGKSVIQEVEYNQIYTYTVYFETAGYHSIFVRDTYGHTQSFTDVFVTQYDGSIQVIDNSDIDLMLNLSARGRNNNEILSDRQIWKDVNTSRPGVAELNNFVWGNVNGWLTDNENVNMLRLSSGASMIVNGYEPFGLNSNNKEGMETGKSIELDFKISNVTDYSLPLITCLSYTSSQDNPEQKEILCGFNITGEAATFNTRNIKATGGEIREGESEQDQAYNTQIQGLTSKFAEGERIHLTWVIQRKEEQYPMIKTYINGIISGITEYTGGLNDANSDSIAQNTTAGSEPALLKIASDVGTVDLYNVRVFNKVLSDRQVLENYIATLPTTEEKTKVYQDNIGLLDFSGNISVANIESGKYQMKIPYIKFTGGGQCRKDDTGYWLTEADGTNHLPRAKKDYRLVNHFDYVDPVHPERNMDLYSKVSKDPNSMNLIEGIIMYGQGTSSMEYPVKNLRIKFKMKDANKKKVKFQVNPNDYPVDILTLKADYMESASSHNTGTANLVFDSLEALGFHTPGQTYWNDQHPEYKTLTAIRGYPIICFFRPDEKSDFEYIGRYNLNMDKSSEEAFGFLPVPKEEADILEDGSNIKFGWVKNDGISSGTNLDPVEHPYVNAIHCYEFLNNASNLDNFICPDKYRKAYRGENLDTFNSDEIYYIKNEEDYIQVDNPIEEDFDSYYIKQNFTKLFYQKEYNDSRKIVPNWLTSFESRYPEDSMDVEAFFQMCLWLNSTNPDEATGETLSEPKYGFTIDNRDYRLAKFTNEFEDHFNKDFVLFYYVLTHVLLMIDSRAKNMMMATWDNQHWYPIFYDMDTMLGLNNYGYNKFDYNVEDKDANIFNGQASILWNNLKICFEADIRDMYDKMQKDGGLTYGNLLRNYNTVQADMWNEIMYNYDATYKYIEPYATGYYDGKNLDDNGKPVMIPAGTKNYLYAAQGSRSMHRKYWLKNRISYFDGKYLSQNYRDDKYTMRLYTPQVGADNYYRAYDVNADNFRPDTYYIRSGELGHYTFAIASTFTPGVEYYAKADNRLATSLTVVPPNNNYVLTPLHNQYLSVAFGGTNGQTSGPHYAVANTPYPINAPAGAQYNDTETYVYGASQIKDLGDLSSQYLGLFSFPGETRLERLVLGNKKNGYYNPNFSQLTIAKAAPQLKYLDISNTQLKGSLDLSNCQNLEEVYACGSSVTSVPLPSYGILRELRLPNTINTLVLNNQTHLTIDKFTIGTYDSVSNTYTMSSTGTLQTISIEGMPQFDSYNLVKINAGTLLYYCLRDVNWVVDASDIIDTSDGLKGIQALETIIIRDVTPQKDGSVTSSARALTGTITFKGSIDAIDTLKVYEHYSNIYPDLVFKFDENSIKHINLYDGDGNIYWSKPIAIGSTLDRDFYNNSSYGEFSVPQKTSTQEFKYTFENKWYIDNDSAQEVIGDCPIIEEPISQDYNFYPLFTSTIQTYHITYHINDEIIIQEAQFGTNWIDTLPKLIPFSNKNETLSISNREVYPFLGYSENSAEAIDNLFNFNTSDKVASNKDFYAVFDSEKVDVSNHKNVFYPAWNIIYRTGIAYKDNVSYNGGLLIPNGDNNLEISEGYVISFKSDWTYNYFATIPSVTVDGQPIYFLDSTSGLNPNSLNRVYCESNSNLIMIYNNCFSNCTSLKYFEFPASLHQIGQSAFQNTTLENSIIGGDNTTYIGEQAFNQALGGDYIKIPGSVSILDGFACSYSSRLNNLWHLQIGDSNHYSYLDLSKFTTAETIDDRTIFGQNDGHRADLIEFYSKNYNSKDTMVGALSVKQHLFGDYEPSEWSMKKEGQG